MAKPLRQWRRKVVPEWQSSSFDRLEYDAYRTDLEELTQGTQGNAISSKMDEAQRNFALHKDKYEKLKADVTIKMKFLEENKVPPLSLAGPLDTGRLLGRVSESGARVARPVVPPNARLIVALTSKAKQVKRTGLCSVFL